MSKSQLTHYYTIINCTIIKFSKPLTSATFTLHHIFYCVAWLSTRSAVAGATLMNEFAPYTMQAPQELKRRTRQRFTKIDCAQRHSLRNPRPETTAATKFCLGPECKQTSLKYRAGIISFLGTINQILANWKFSVIFNSVFIITRSTLNLARE